MRQIPCFSPVPPEGQEVKIMATEKNLITQYAGIRLKHVSLITVPYCLTFFVGSSCSLLNRDGGEFPSVTEEML